MNAGIFFILKNKIIKKTTYFLVFFLSKIFVFKYFWNCNIQSLLNYKRKISWKFEVSSSKIEEEDRFLVISKYSQFKFALPIRNLLRSPTLIAYIPKITLNFKNLEKTSCSLYKTLYNIIKLCKKWFTPPPLCS